MMKVWDKIEVFRNAINNDEYVISALIKSNVYR